MYNATPQLVHQFERPILESFRVLVQGEDVVLERVRQPADSSGPAARHIDLVARLSAEEARELRSALSLAIGMVTP